MSVQVPSDKDQVSEPQQPKSKSEPTADIRPQPQYHNPDPLLKMIGLTIEG